MRAVRWLTPLFLLMVATWSLAGDVRVVCGPGLRILLDGQLVGTSTAEDNGLSLPGVANGEHTIRVEKDGCLPRQIKLTVSDAPLEVQVGQLAPLGFGGTVSRHPAEPSRAREGREGDATLFLTSDPESCMVAIDGQTEPKIVPTLAKKGLAPGQHTVLFSAHGRQPVSRVIDLQPGEELTVHGDLVGGRVKIVSEGQGSMELFTTPSICTVRFRGQKVAKRYSMLKMTHIPAGEYRLVLSRPGVERTVTVEIKKDRRARVEVNLTDPDGHAKVSYQAH